MDQLRIDAYKLAKDFGVPDDIVDQWVEDFIVEEVKESERQEAEERQEFEMMFDIVSFSDFADDMDGDSFEVARVRAATEDDLPF